MKKKILTLALLASAASVIALSSCGSSTVENAGEEFKLLSLDDIKGEKITVEFWHSFGHDITNTLNGLVESFEEEMQKQGFDIDVVAKSIGGGYDGLRERVNMGTRSKAIPTMILGYPDHFADYISHNILLPLNDFVYASDTDIALEGVSQTENDYIASYWAENQMTIKGESKIAGIPFNKSTEIMVYNASLLDPILEAKGYLNEDDKWANPTWDQVWEISQYIIDNKSSLTWRYNSNTGESNTTDGALYSLDATNMKYPVYVDSAANFFITASRQWGGEGKYTVVDNAGAGTVVSNNTTNKEAMTYFKEKADAGLFQFPTKVSQNYGSALLNNLTGFISIGSTAGIKNNESSKYELKATAIPQKAGTSTKAVIQQGTNLTILTANSNNKTRLAAWMLIKYLTNTENTQTFSKATGYLPVRESALNSSAYQNFLANEDNVFNGSVARAINAAFSQKEYFYTDPAFSGSSIVRDKTDVMVEDIFQRNMSFDEAVKSLYDELKMLSIKTN